MKGGPSGLKGSKQVACDRRVSRWHLVHRILCALCSIGSQKSRTANTIVCLLLLASLISNVFACGPWPEPSVHFRGASFVYNPPARHDFRYGIPSYGYTYELFQPFPKRTRTPVTDESEVFRQIDSKTDRRLAKSYLRARALYDRGELEQAERLVRGVYFDRKSGFLRAHALYTLASIEYDRSNFRRAAGLYERVVREFPKSLKRDEALIMGARCLLRSPPQSHPTHYWEWVDAPKPSPEDVQRGRALLWQLLEQYPRTRFRFNALGWLGRCEYVRKRYADALRFYLKQLDTATSEGEATTALHSVRIARRKMTATDALRFHHLLLSQPSLVAPYLDYRLYHCANDQEDLNSLVHLAERIARRRPRRPDLAIALAEIERQRGRHRKSLRWANRALTSLNRRNMSAGRDLAYFLRGLAKSQLKRRREAIADFEALLRRYPRTYLAPAAHEQLAMLYEDGGQLGKALDQYFALNYHADVAYFLDARMSTADIRRYLASHPHHSKPHLLIYSLGMRYLRADKLDRAERSFDRLSPHALQRLRTEKWKAEWPSLEEEGVQPPSVKGLNLKYNPLETIHDLRRLKAAVTAAHTPEVKAQSLYSLATYYYVRRNLLLYNAPLWQGIRADNFGFFWNTGHLSKQDDIAAHKHQYEHECLNRAREICFKIVRRYPNSSVAPKALYRAACCSRRLANFNGWWRKENSRHNYWKESVRLMNEMARRYPHDPLAPKARKYAAVFEKERREGW